VSFMPALYLVDQIEQSILDEYSNKNVAFRPPSKMSLQLDDVTGFSNSLTAFVSVLAIVLFGPVVEQGIQPSPTELWLLAISV
jgi:hypothetical protein